MEKHDLYDINRIPTGETINRGDVVPENRYRIVVHIIIFNDDGDMLIQQRQPWKSYPEKWDFTVGGSVVSGETSGEGASRELFEELGIDIDLSNTLPSITIPFLSGFCDFYVITKDIQLDELTLQESEVKDVMWASKEDVLKMIENQTFIEYRKSLVDLLFDCNIKKYGTWAKK